MQRNKGFTIVEVLISIAVLSIISVIIISGFLIYSSSVKRMEKNMVAEAAIEICYTVFSDDPSRFKVNISKYKPGEWNNEFYYFEEDNGLYLKYGIENNYVYLTILKGSKVVERWQRYFC